MKIIMNVTLLRELKTGDVFTLVSSSDEDRFIVFGACPASELVDVINLDTDTPDALSQEARVEFHPHCELRINPPLLYP